jgi:hypothetical protein
MTKNSEESKEDFMESGRGFFKEVPIMDRKDLFGLTQRELVNLAERQATIIRNWIRSFKLKSPIKKLFNKEPEQEKRKEGD